MASNGFFPGLTVEHASGFNIVFASGLRLFSKQCARVALALKVQQEAARAAGGEGVRSSSRRRARGKQRHRCRFEKGCSAVKRGLRRKFFSSSGSTAHLQHTVSSDAGEQHARSDI